MLNLSQIYNGSLQVKGKSYGFVSAKIKSHLSLSNIPYNILNDIFPPLYLARSMSLNDSCINVSSLLKYVHRKLVNGIYLNNFSTEAPKITGKVIKRNFQNMYNIFIGGEYFGCAKTQEEADKILKFGIDAVEYLVEKSNTDLEGIIINGEE